MNLAARLAGIAGLAGVAVVQLASPAPVAAHVATQGAMQATTPAPSIINPCNGELVLTSGFQHTVTLSQGGHVLIHENLQNVKGTGQNTGLPYVISGTTEFHANVNPKTGHAVFTDVMTLHVISPSTGQNFISTIIFHNVGTKVVSHDNSRCTTGGSAALLAAAPQTAAPAAALTTTSQGAGHAATSASGGTAQGTAAGTAQAAAPVASSNASHRFGSASGLLHSNAAPGQQHSSSSVRSQSTASGTPASPAHSPRYRNL